MKVDKSVWHAAMNALMRRRAKGYTLKNSDNKTGDYKSHLSKVHIGKKVLDVGCGHMHIKQFMPPETIYVGIDPFPINAEVINMEIENNTFSDNEFDTVFCFAVLDGVHDLSKTMAELTRICKGNIVMLTGVNIPVDQYHTFQLTEQMLSDALPDFRQSYREELQPKVLLLEYTKND